MPRSWYGYNGIGDPILASSYGLATIRAACINGCKICAIYVPGGGGTPTAPLSTNMRNYIFNFLVTGGLAQPDSGANIKKYVYGRTC